MKPKITGNAAEHNDNNPVEVRRYEILGSTLDDAIGRFPETRIFVGGSTYAQYHHWQYFPTGMIVSSTETCASVLYGSIAQYYADRGAFRGPLGFPRTDVLRLPDGTFYAVFENGVIWEDPDHGPTELRPMDPSMVRSFANVDVTASGIAGFAQARVGELAAGAMATREDLKKWVSGITTTVSFVGTGPGGCSGAGFDAVGRSLNRSHVFRVHLDIDIKGCAGAFGDASADLTIEVRTAVVPPRVSARLVGFRVDAVSSPFSAADSDMRAGLTRALNEQYARDLMGRSLPDGYTVLAALVNKAGDVDIYIEPLCGVKKTLRAGPRLDFLRRSRDLVDRLGGAKLSASVDLLSPAVAHRVVRSEGTVAALDAMVARAMEEHPDPERWADRLAEPLRELTALIDSFSVRGDTHLTGALLARASAFVEEAARSGWSLDGALERSIPMIRKERERIDALPAVVRDDRQPPLRAD